MKKTPSISTYAMIAIMLFLFNACKKDDAVNTAPPTLTEVTNLVDRNTPLTIVDYGEWISIRGTNLSTTYKVDFNGTLAADSLIYGDDNTITVKIPAQLTDLLNNPITVTTKYGSATLNFQIKQPAPKISSFDPPAGLPNDLITIKGDYFTGVTAVKFETTSVPIVSSTQTEIKVKIPVGFASGYIFVTTPMGTIKSTNVFGLKATIFDDAMAPGWSNTSYSNTYDMTQTTIIRRGTKAIVNKFTVGFGAIRFTKSAPAFSTTGYSGVKISIYGGAGTAGKKVRISFTPAASTFDLILTEGSWTDYQIPFTNLGNPASMTAITFQEFSGLLSQIYVDDVGFY
ncbi:hypothetical protein FBD94_23775 [Pedobacter hiemivivus]|uniref:IPT/TIG domain-containing protein n=1 Tax=Pedobacter hiemivivus TaxID=2530454 RepID=A0A4U1FZE9_9SPHI|nr:IPT/TIG domain-containing protein [Pedobacter hiemivivus]TKC55949.1 hypothetical protein FBD94_23775 [Pedobacter hiemivivus]